MATTVISPRYRLTIPKDIREQCDLHAGDHVGFLKKGDELVIVKVPEHPLAAMAGSLSSDGDVRQVLRTLKADDILAEEGEVEGEHENKSKGKGRGRTQAGDRR